MMPAIVVLLALASAPGPAQSAARPDPDPPGPANHAVARTDENSRRAHAELLEKARTGTIDLYFVGDSIVRRWGATDYPELLAHWRQTFFGWNAANFGWGADRIQHMLWRLENGELENVHPKAIVILAGTNNLGPEPADAAKIADITRGIQALVEACQTRAPAATIVLTAIFPRNDNMALMPDIDRINQNLARLADGRRIRFLDVNRQLADSGGRLFPAMMNDDQLHPAIPGYQVWADGLRPILTELLGAPAATDQAPPPTGDPSRRPPARLAPLAFPIW
jgi:lysophospholipase L1-like esterase